MYDWLRKWVTLSYLEGLKHSDAIISLSSVDVQKASISTLISWNERQSSWWVSRAGDFLTVLPRASGMGYDQKRNLWHKSCEVGDQGPIAAAGDKLFCSSVTLFLFPPFLFFWWKCRFLKALAYLFSQHSGLWSTMCYRDTNNCFQASEKTDTKIILLRQNTLGRSSQDLF